MMSEKDASQWFIARDGKQTGPIADIEIKAIAAHGYFKATDLVWQPGFSEWRSALAVFPPAAAPPLPAQPALPKSEPGSELTAVPSRPVVPRAEPAPAGPVGRFLGAPLDIARLPAEPPYAVTTGRASASAAAPDPREPKPARKSALSSDNGGTQAPPHKTNRVAIAALVVTVATVAAGVWFAAYPGLVKGLPAAATVAVREAPPAAAAAVSTTELEARWEKTAHWPVIKREFPDWYGDRLREAATLEAEKKSDAEITRLLVGQLISLRRQNAPLALSASTPKLKALASAFLENLRQLKAQSTTTCFNFISQGENTPGVIDLMQETGGEPSSMQLQVAAIFDAIGDGRKSPVAHEKPQKADYDALMEQLAKLGWTQADVATFSDPNALAHAEPARVCQMVQDWFVAHISIADEPTLERLLSETLRPVVSG